MRDVRDAYNTTMGVSAIEGPGTGSRLRLIGTVWDDHRSTGRPHRPARRQARGDSSSPSGNGRRSARGDRGVGPPKIGLGHLQRRSAPSRADWPSPDPARRQERPAARHHVEADAPRGLRAPVRGGAGDRSRPEAMHGRPFAPPDDPNLIEARRRAGSACRVPAGPVAAATRGPGRAGLPRRCPQRPSAARSSASAASESSRPPVASSRASSSSEAASL